MHALIVDPARRPETQLLVNRRLSTRTDLDEGWLQQLLFEHPTLMPMDLISSGASSFVPVSRERRYPKMEQRYSSTFSGSRPLVGQCWLNASCGATRRRVARSSACWFRRGLT
jgi:hypothetical protein